MKEFRAKEGPFPLRLHYEAREIDDICLDALRKAGLLPMEPEAIKIDLFLEKYFEVPVLYEDLGKSVMGSTVFNSRGAVTGFTVAPWIEEDGTAAADRRVRSTLAHEGGHGLLHPRLFIIEQTGDLFGEVRESPKSFLCRGTDISPTAGATPQKYDGQWWEWQANRAIGGLLLPKPLVRKFLSKMLTTAAGVPTLPDAKRGLAEREVSMIFDVNPVVARIRLQELFPRENQPGLGFAP